MKINQNYYTSDGNQEDDGSPSTEKVTCKIGSKRISVLIILYPNIQIDHSTLSASRKFVKPINADMSTNISSNLMLKGNLRFHDYRPGPNSSANDSSSTVLNMFEQYKDVSGNTPYKLCPSNVSLNTTKDREIDDLESTIAHMENNFKVLKKIEKETDVSKKLLNSSVNKLKFVKSDNIGKCLYFITMFTYSNHNDILDHHLLISNSQKVKELEEEIETLRDERLDYDLLQQNFAALEQYCKRLESDLEAVSEANTITKRIQYNHSQFEKRKKSEMRKHKRGDTDDFPSLKEYVSVKKYSQLADKLTKERVKSKSIHNLTE